MIDILFLAHNRLEFTREAARQLLLNTDWDQVRSVQLYDDNSTDGTRDLMRELRFPAPTHVSMGTWGGPVAVMNDAIAKLGPDSIMFKIDNDTVVPPGWLGECLGVMERQPEIDLLGIEAFRPVCAVDPNRGADPAGFIGGIGLMRLRAFTSLPRADGRWGFTAWQEQNEQVHKAWLNPALPVVLLNLVPFEPWRSLSREYIAAGWQRDWPEPYTEERADLWSWWKR